jgi:hypothetical protein
MTQQNFDGGNSGDNQSAYFGYVGYIEDRVAWNKGNLDLDGKYRVKLTDINVAYATNVSYTRIRVGGDNFGSGAIISDKDTTTAYVRLYKNSTASTYFESDTSGGPIDDFIKGYNNSDTLLSTFSPRSLSGNYEWATVPTAPAIGTPTVNGQLVTVTYTNSSSTGDSAITSYNMQYSSDAGVTWSAAVVVTGNTNTFSLAATTTYTFRVYATNAVGNGAASVSSAVTTTSASRGRVYKDGAWGPSTVARIYKDGSWQNITVFRKYNGTAWVDLTT